MSVVIGAGPAAARAAAVTGSLLLDTGPPGMPVLPEGPGCADARHREVIARWYGAAPLVPAAGRESGLAVGGRVHRLPLSPVEVLALFDARIVPAVIRGWARARSRRAVRRLIGGGLEERTYADWVTQRFGEAAYRALYAPYARLRWGDPERLSVSAARLVHGQAAPEQLVAPGESPGAGWAALEAAVPERRRTAVRGLRLEDGAVVAVLTDAGEVPVDGALYCAAPPPRVVGWLGEHADEGLRFDAAGLGARTRIQVALALDPGGLPALTHVAGPPGTPFFLLTRPDRLPGGEALAGTLVAHLSLSEQHPLAGADDAAVARAVAAALPGAVGLPAPEPGGARVQRIPDCDPCWRAGTWHPAQNRVMLALAERGITLVGPAGTHRYTDPGQELAFLEGLISGALSPHELQRTLLDPPVLLAEDAPSIGRFAQR